MSLGRVNALLGIRVHIGRKEGSNHNFANNAASFIGAYEEEYGYSVGGGGVEGNVLELLGYVNRVKYCGRGRDVANDY